MRFNQWLSTVPSGWTSFKTMTTLVKHSVRVVDAATMAVLLQTHYTLSLPSPRYPYLFSIRNPNSIVYNFLIPTTPLKSQLQFSNHWNPTHRSPASPVSASRRETSDTTPLNLPRAFVHLVVSAALFLCCGVRACSASLPPLTNVVQQEQTIQGFQRFLIR